MVFLSGWTWLRCKIGFSCKVGNLDLFRQMSLPSRWNFSSTASLNFYQQQISVRLLRPMPIWCLHKDSINVTSILRDCVGGEVATTSVLIWTEGLFISGLSGSWALLSLCSGAEIYSMARGRWVISATMGELCLNRVDFTQGLIVARCVWATQLRHSSRCRNSSVSA